LAVAGRVNAKIHACPRNLIRRDHVNPFVVWAVDDEEVYLSGVIPSPGSVHVRLNASRTELDYPISETPGLALGLEEYSFVFHHEVVALIDAIRNTDSVTAGDQLIEDRRLAAMPDVNGVVGQERFHERRTHVRTLFRSPDEFSLPIVLRMGSQ
jgi:hypothetical protein